MPMLQMYFRSKNKKLTIEIYSSIELKLIENDDI